MASEGEQLMDADLSPYRPVKLPPFPADSVIPGASAEDVMGLAVAAPCGGWRVIVDFAAGTISYVPPWSDGCPPTDQR